MTSILNDPLLQIRDLQVAFGTRGRQVTAVRGVDLTVMQGQAFGIVGESGSGKSVTARAILGLLPALSSTVTGSIRVRGREVVGMPYRELRRVRRHDVSMIFQDPMRSLNPTMTVGAQISESIQQGDPDLSKARRRRRALELLDLVRMPAADDRLSAYPHQLSGGMRQRVGIAMALASRPALLVADEPTTALDVTVQAEILDLLDETRRELGMALILITHDLHIAAQRTDAIAVMYAGQIVEAGPADHVVGDMRMPYSRALFAAVPSATAPRHSTLPAIPGRPPTLNDDINSCAFAPRCPQRARLSDEEQRICDTEIPSETVEGDHRFRCWFPLADRPTLMVPERGIT